MAPTPSPAARGLTVGDRVLHPTRPEWGLGQVLDLDSSKAGVFFVEAGRKVVSLQHVSFAVLDPRPKDPLLDRIDATDDSMSQYRSIRQSVKGFLNAYEGGFYGDHYLRTERDYKVAAHELARTILGRAELEPLRARGAFADICHRAMQVVNKTNLIFPNEKMALKDGLKPAGRERAFALALDALLHGEGKLPSRFDSFAAVLDFLSHRDSETDLTRMAMAASEPVLSAVWDNPDDAEYGALRVGRTTS